MKCTSWYGQCIDGAVIKVLGSELSRALPAHMHIRLSGDYRLSAGTIVYLFFSRPVKDW